MTRAVTLVWFAGCVALSVGLARAQEQEQRIPEDRVAVLSYAIVDGVSAPDPLTDAAGDVARGKDVFLNPELGGCATCHWTPDVGGEPGELAGPSLADVGARLASGVIRLWIINPRALSADAKMPAYFSLEPEEERIAGDIPERDASLLTAQEIEDLVAYLESLTAPPPSAASE